MVEGGESVILDVYLPADVLLADSNFSASDGQVGAAKLANARLLEKVRLLESVWNLPQSLGTYQAVAQVSYVNGRKDSCEVKVIVTAPKLGPGVQPGKAWLVRTNSAKIVYGDPGYGAYTYLLLSDSTDTDSMARNRMAASAFLNGIRDDIIGLQSVFEDKSTLNICYVPVKADAGSLNATPELLIKPTIYDYSSARKLKNLVGRNLLYGPYLVTSPSPLGLGPKPQLIYQDLGQVPASLVELWIRIYLNQLAQQTIYGRRFEPSLALRMRTVLEVIGTAIPNVSTAVTSWIKILPSQSASAMRSAGTGRAK